MQNGMDTETFSREQTIFTNRKCSPLAMHTFKGPAKEVSALSEVRLLRENANRMVDWEREDRTDLFSFFVP